MLSHRNLVANALRRAIDAQRSGRQRKLPVCLAVLTQLRLTTVLNLPIALGAT